MWRRASLLPRQHRPCPHGTYRGTRRGAGRSRVGRSDVLGWRHVESPALAAGGSSVAADPPRGLPPADRSADRPGTSLGCRAVGERRRGPLPQRGRVAVGTAARPAGGGDGERAAWVATPGRRHRGPDRAVASTALKPPSGSPPAGHHAGGHRPRPRPRRPHRAPGHRHRAAGVPAAADHSQAARRGGRCASAPALACPAARPAGRRPRRCDHAAGTPLRPRRGARPRAAERRAQPW